MISSSASPELTTFQSLSTAEEKKLAPADFKAILEQVDERLKNKYKIATLKLNGSFTPEQLSQLAEKMQKVEAEWKAAINLADYKADLLADKYRSDDDELSDYALGEKFDQFKADSKLWNLDIEATGDDEGLVAFVATQLQAKKIWALILQQCLSEKSMERIIYACKNASPGVIFFENSEQIVTDLQAQILLHCVTSSQLRICKLPGKNISAITAEQFAIARTKGNNWVEINDCSYFDERSAIEYYLDYPQDLYFGLTQYNFLADDIERLTPKLTNSATYTAEFSLSSGSYTDPKWVTFFTQVLQSSTKITALTIGSNTEMSNEVLFAIIESIGINKTIGSLTISKSLSSELVIALADSLRLNTTLKTFAYRQYDPNHIRMIVESLSTHPALTSLMLNNSRFRGLRGVFRNLLTQTKTLEELYLVETGCDDDTIAGLAEALADNTSVTKLCLSGNNFTDLGLDMLSHAVIRNQRLTHLSFLQQGEYYTISGVEHFVDCLQLNKSIVETAFSWKTEDKKQIAPIEQRHDSVVARNKRLAYFRRLEKAEEECQPYVEITIVLFQAHRQQHANWSVLVMLEKILSFLVPPTTFAWPNQVKRCTDLVQSNLLTKPFQWKTSMEEKNHWSTASFMIFKKWDGATDTFKESKSKVQAKKLLS